MDEYWLPSLLRLRQNAKDGRPRGLSPPGSWRETAGPSSLKRMQQQAAFGPPVLVYLPCFLSGRQGILYGTVGDGSPLSILHKGSDLLVPGRLQ